MNNHEYVLLVPTPFILNNNNNIQFLYSDFFIFLMLKPLHNIDII